MCIAFKLVLGIPIIIALTLVQLILNVFGMLNSVLTKEILAKLGYPSMLGQYLKVCENL